MLEFMHEDIVKRFHCSFLEHYSKLESLQDKESFHKVKECYLMAKRNTKVEGRIEFYLSAFFHHLKIDGTNLEIEIYKKSSRLNQTHTVTKDQQQKKTLLRYVNTFNKECLRLENYDYRLLFQKVAPNMLMQMFVCLLHERKIILIHNDSSKNAILIETLISLLYPLQWNFTNISYLIPSMVEYLEAPFPYIVGVPRDLWKFIYEQKWDVLGEEVVAFDIDNARVFNKEELPEFPQPYTSMLIEQLKKQIENGKKISARGRQQAQLSVEDFKKEEDRFWNHFTLKVKQQFVNFLIFVINNFENFYINKKEATSTTANAANPLNPAESMINAQQSTLDSSRIQQQNTSSFLGNAQNQNHNGLQFQGGSANDIFDFEEYIQNFKDNQSFFEKFLRTQAFINFIEQAYYEEQGNLSDASIRFFKECTRKLSSENLQALRAMQDSMIQGLIHKFSERSISYSIDKCHLIYEKTLQSLSNQEQNPIAQSKAQNFHSLVQSLEHSKIIKMQQFDPTLIIEQRFSKAQETLFDVQNLQKQRRDNSLHLNKDHKAHSNNLQDFQQLGDSSLLYKDNLNIFLQDSSQTADRRQHHQVGDRLNALQFGTNEAGSELSLMFQQPNFNTSNVPDYFTVQATPINNQSRANFGLDLEQNKNNMNKTTNLIKIEDDYDGQAFEESRIIQSRDHSLNQIDCSPHHQPELDGHSSSEEKETAGFLGFFKKTFSSVKKTFESTFNPHNQGRETTNQIQNSSNNNNNSKFLKSKSQQRPAAKSTYSQQRPTGLFGFMTGSNTPDLIINESQDRAEEQESPEILGNKRTAAFANGDYAAQSKAQNRAARSQTFHSKEVTKQTTLLGNQSQRNQINPINKGELQKQNSAVREKEVKRDRKANNSFFASLWNLGSSRKNKLEEGGGENEMRQIQSLSPQKNQPKGERDKIVLTKKNRNRTLNGSGFFVFNEEDMKHMTEMSPQNLLYKQNSEQAQIKVLKFDFQQMDSQLSQRQSQQQPFIKNPPMLDAQQNSLLNRLRSISHQNQTQTRQLVGSHQNSSSNKVQQRRDEREMQHYVSHSLNKLGGGGEDSSKSMFHNYQTLFIDSKQNPQVNRQTFAAKGGFSPIVVEDMDSRNNHQFRDKMAPQHLIFNLEEDQKFSNFHSTPKYQTHQSAKQRESRVNKDEFEQLYKQSTEKLLYPPLNLPQNPPPAAAMAPTLSKSSSKEKFTMWKSQTSKINLKGTNSGGSLTGQNSGGNIAHYTYTLSSTGNNISKGRAQKPPKHHYKVVKKNSLGSTLSKPNKSLSTSNHHNHNNSMTTNVKALQQQLARKEEKLALQRSLTSDLCNDRNSTDEDLNAPISGLHLLQFQNIMHNSKAFDKMNQQQSSSILNTTQTIKLEYEEHTKNNKTSKASKPADSKAQAAPTVTNFSLQNKGQGKSNQHPQNIQKTSTQQASHSKHNQPHQNAHSKHLSAGVMQSLGLNAAQPSLTQTNPRHKRQISNGMQSVQVVGESSIQSPLIENIEPDEDCQKVKQFDRQIESMQLGRVRKKSSNKASMVSHGNYLQNRTNNHHQYHNSTNLTRKNSTGILNQSTQVHNQAQLNTSQANASLSQYLNNTTAANQAKAQNAAQKQSSSYSNTQRRVQKQVGAAQKISIFIQQQQQPPTSQQTPFNDTNQQLKEVLREMNLKEEKPQMQKSSSKNASTLKASSSHWKHKHYEEKKQNTKQTIVKSNQPSCHLVGSRNQKGGLDLQARVVASAEEAKLFAINSSQTKTVELSASWQQLSHSRSGERCQERVGGGGGTISKMSQSRQNAALPVKTIESSSQESIEGEEEDMECLREEEENEGQVINLEQEHYDEKANHSIDQSSSRNQIGRPHSQNSIFATNLNNNNNNINNSNHQQPNNFNLLSQYNNFQLEQSLDNSRSKTIERKSHLNPLPLRSSKKRQRPNSECESPIHSSSSFSRTSKKEKALARKLSSEDEDFNSDDLKAHDEDFIESLANREQNSSSYINAINQSVDFRDSKRREGAKKTSGDILIQSEALGAGVISPTNQIRKFNEQSKGGFISQNIVDKDTFAMRMGQNQSTFHPDNKISLRQSMQNQDNLYREMHTAKPVQSRVHSQSQHAQVDSHYQARRNQIHQSEFQHSLSPKQKIQMDQKIPSPTNNLHQRNLAGNQRGYLPNSQPQSRLQIMAAATHAHRPVAESSPYKGLNSLSKSMTLKQNQTSATNQVSLNTGSNTVHHYKNYPSNALQVNLHRHHPSEQPTQLQQPISSSQIPQNYFTSSNQNQNNYSSDKQQKAKQQQQPSLKINIPNQSQKPLNKMALDAFSQIAKLSGDVDHEPHTPKSGGLKKGFNNGGQHNTTEEIESMSDCEDVY